MKMIRTLLIKDHEMINVKKTYDDEIDLLKNPPKDCVGCWNCWMKTPGRCAHKDLDAFYRAYLKADQVVIVTRAPMGFVSSQLKTLLDRLIPLLFALCIREDWGI